MSLHFTPDEAAKLGIISKEQATEMKREAQMHKRGGRSGASDRKRTRKAVDPQQILFQALCERLPGLPEHEKQGLVPGRRFRADIFIPPNIVVEFDGFRYHSSN